MKSTSPGDKDHQSTAMTFRYWCGAAGCYVSDYKYTGWLEEFLDPDSILLPQQSTGIMDAQHEVAYEGDIIRIPEDARAVDWECGTKCAVSTSEIKGSLLGEVTRDPSTPCNMWISVRTELDLEVVLPLELIKVSQIIGNNFQESKDKMGSKPSVWDQGNLLVQNSYYRFRFWCHDFGAYGRVWYSGDGRDALALDGTVITEQCTGLRDRQGHYVFENDILNGEKGTHVIVRSARAPSNLVAVNETGGLTPIQEVIRNSTVSGRSDRLGLLDFFKRVPQLNQAN